MTNSTSRNDSKKGNNSSSDKTATENKEDVAVAKGKNLDALGVDYSNAKDNPPKGWVSSYEMPQNIPFIRLIVPFESSMPTTLEYDGEEVRDLIGNKIWYFIVLSSFSPLPTHDANYD